MRRLIVYAVIMGAWALGSCLPKQGIPDRRPGPYPAPSSPRSSTSEAYIERYKGIAVQEMEIYGIPASITMAQAILESGSGNSYLARVANNHFGIKCASGWTGKSVRQNDDRRGECFRVYGSAEESFRDHSEFLLRPRYADLFKLDKNDYKAWAKGLKKAGYATNPRYPELLINLIENYALYRFDKPEVRQNKAKREVEIQQEIAVKAPEEELAAEAKPPVKMSIHEVRSGDTLSSIARMYHLSVEELQTLNALEGNQLYVGQLLLVSK